MSQARTGRRAGALRWGEEERRLLSRLLDLHTRDPENEEACDPRRSTDVAYLRVHWERHQFFSRHPVKNFYQNVRRACNEWLANEAAEGTRRRESPLLFFRPCCFFATAYLFLLLLPHTQKKQ